jgi:hypothetical protein
MLLVFGGRRGGSPRKTTTSMSAARINGTSQVFSKRNPPRPYHPFIQSRAPLAGFGA